MLWSAALVLCGLAAADAGRQVSKGGALRHASVGGSFVRSIDFKHVLRVCNAYAYDLPMDVFMGKEKLTKEPMAYKVCHDLKPDVQVGDKLDFKVADDDAASFGTFTVQELPNNDAVLLLVIHRHDPKSYAVAFESHVFANLLNAQVAVVDAYRGPEKATARIADADGHAHELRSEELRYDSVVAINAGQYEVTLVAPNGEIKSRERLVAVNRESYVVLRCGITGSKFPDALVVYPRSEAGQVKSGAPAPRPAAWALLALLTGLLASTWR